MQNPELEKIIDELDEIADGVASVHLLRARQLRGVIRKLTQIARNEPRQETVRIGEKV